MSGKAGKDCHFFALVSRQSAALSPATQHAMPLEFDRKLAILLLEK